SKDQWGAVMDPSDPIDLWHILWVLAKQMGGDFISANMATSTMTSDPVYKAFRFWFDRMANYKIAKTSDVTFKGPDLLNNFDGGKVGFMVMQGPTSIPTLEKSAVKGKYAFAPMPTVPYGMTSLPSGGVPVQIFVSGQYLTIAKFSKLQDDAIRWMKYVTDVTQQMQFLKTYGYMPGMVDGCSRLQLLRHIVAPLTIPGMIVAFIFSFLLSWNEVLFASVLTSSQTKTLGVGLPGYLASGEAGGQVFWNQLMGASIVSAIPAIVLFLLVQRFIVSGLTPGAVKG
ncbi:MAG TPA: extracellular solute-binding protein, partial [Chloroflexota bacterium]|nr:extracellular solute-binding protein [Chloroflexota bacterium]